MNVHNDILVRITGMPFDILPRDNSLILFAEEINKSQIELSSKIDRLLDDLHHFNLTQNDLKLQQAIQTYRRSLYKTRRGFIEDHFLLKIPKKTQINIKDLSLLYQKIDDLKSDFECNYQAYLSKERADLKPLVSNKIFLDGVRMGSHSIYNSTLKYLKIPVEKFGKKEFATEKGILKYLSRACSKTSPFSTLTSLSIAKISNDLINESIQIKNQKSKIVSTLKINSLMQLFLRELVFSDKEILKNFNIRINSTLTIESEVYTFMINKNNLEVFQRISKDEVLEKIIDHLQVYAISKFSTLTDLLEVVVDASKEELQNYLLNCINSGLLEVDLGLSGIDPDWPSSLYDILLKSFQKDIPIKIKILLDTLSEMNKTVSNYNEVDFNDKIHLLTAGYQVLQNCLNSLSIPSDFEKKEDRKKPITIKQEHVFVEDTTNSIEIKFNKSHINVIGNLLFNLHQSIDILDIKFSEKHAMYAYFNKKYVNIDKIPLLKFHEDYCRDIKATDHSTQSKEFKDSQSEQLNNFVKNNKNEMEKKIQLWKEFVWKGINYDSKGTKDIKIDQNLINKANEAAGINIDREKKRSVASFLHLPLKNNTFDYAVVNSVFSGYGKMYSRFLHLFPKEVTESLRKHNQAKQPTNAIFAELQDGSFHNANIHPPLLEYEIRIPGGHKSLPEEQQILVSDIDIIIDRSKEDLSLICKKTNKIIYPFDLGFQGTAGRSRLFNLLNTFSYANYNATVLLTNYINSKIFNSNIDQDFTAFPRIFYEEKICLQRKTWVIKLDKIPIKERNESDSEYFYSIHEWRKKLHLPDCVFIRLKPNVIPLKQDKKIEGDDYKPQFLDFCSPLFISLFEKLMKKSANYIQMEEMLPNGEELVTTPDGSYVTEFYLQVDNG